MLHSRSSDTGRMKIFFFFFKKKWEGETHNLTTVMSLTEFFLYAYRTVLGSSCFHLCPPTTLGAFCLSLIYRGGCWGPESHLACPQSSASREREPGSEARLTGTRPALWTTGEEIIFIQIMKEKQNLCLKHENAPRD